MVEIGAGFGVSMQCSFMISWCGAVNGLFQDWLGNQIQQGKWQHLWCVTKMLTNVVMCCQVTPILVDCCHSWCYTGEIYDDLVETFFFCGLVVSCKSRWKVSVGKLCKECLCSNYMKCILPCQLSAPSRGSPMKIWQKVSAEPKGEGDIRLLAKV